LSSSYLISSASFDQRILTNSSSISQLSSSFINTSSSLSVRVTSLEQFSSSLDLTFATDAQLNAATASLSSSISSLSSSYLESSASFDIRILNNSSSITQLSSSFLSFSSSYNTGSFTGSFIGDGSRLTNIRSSEITGSLSITGSISLLGSTNNSLTVRGSGTTSATTALNIRNSNNTSSLIVLDNGDTLIGYSGYTGYKLDVDGAVRMRGTLNMFGSITGSAGIARGMNIQQSLSASANNDTLVGLDVVNNYNTGSYTGVVKWGARILGGPILNEFNENASAGLSIANNNTGPNALISITLRSGSTTGGTLAYVPGSYGVPTFANALSLSAIGNTKLFFTANADGTATAQDIILNTSVTNLFAPPFAPSVTIKANNNVLIGTATDSGFKLDVSGSGRFSNNLTITGSLNVTGSTILKGPGTTTGTSLLVENSAGTDRLSIIDNGNIAFNTNHLFISGSGNIGIGTTTPTTTLDVSGSGRFTNNLTTTGSLNVTGSSIFRGNITTTGSLNVTGSSIFRGNTTITGSLSISGSTTQVGNNTLIGTTTLTGSILINGNIIPQLSSSFDLGSVTNPWRALYVQSGSISIQSDIPGGVPAVISNANGNVSIAAAGLQLKSGSFIPFEVSTTARTIIRVPNLPANDIGGLSIIGSSDGSYQPITNAGGLLHLTSNDGQSSRITSDAFGTTAVAAYVGRKARGTAATPLPVQVGDTLTRISTIGWTGPEYGFTMSASAVLAATAIETIALDNFTTSSFGTRFQFYNAPSGSTIRTLSATIDTTGIQTSGSIRAASFTGSFSGSLVGTVVNAQTASYVNPLNQNVVITGSLTLSSGSALRINDGLYVNGNKQFNYGQFSSTQTQSGSANTAYSATFNTTDFSQGVSLISGSRITVSNTGIYNIQFSTQLHTTANQAVDFSIWFAMTGSDIANSNTDFTIEKINGGGFVVAALNFLVQLQSNDYVELKYSKTTAQGQLQAKGIQSTPTRPATPSVILTVTQIA
jgi:hypothetical protein